MQKIIQILNLLGFRRCMIALLLSMFQIPGLYSQWTASTLLSQMGLQSNNFYTVVPDPAGGVALGGDNGWLIYQSSTGIQGNNTIYNPIKTIAFIND
ncbi:MAG: hypothetical protein IAF38_16880, partial [Bacteroidia bacterium]|nr:hypothetical protein [Bacteroidia bacterium]